MATLKSLSSRLANKWKQPYSKTCGYINSGFAITLVRATHRCICGSCVSAHWIDEQQPQCLLLRQNPALLILTPPADGHGGLAPVRCSPRHKHIAPEEEGVGGVTLLQYNYRVPYVAVNEVDPEVGPTLCPNMASLCRSPFTLDMCYGLIPPHGSNIVNAIIPSKPRLCARFS